MYDDKYFDAKWRKIIKLLPHGGEYRYNLRGYGYQIIVDYIGKNKSVFDFASGLSILGAKLERNGCTVSGCDISPVAVQWCKENVSSDYRVTDKMFGGPYDYMVASYFLEHIEDPVEWLRDSLRACGSVICSIPNNFNRTGEHNLMAWKDWGTFNKLFSGFAFKRIDEGLYPAKLMSAYKHPIFVFQNAV